MKNKKARMRYGLNEPLDDYSDDFGKARCVYALDCYVRPDDLNMNRTAVAIRRPIWLPDASNITVSWQPRCRRNRSFRPVALRPRLSTSLPLTPGFMFTQHGDSSQAQGSLSADKVRSICEKKRIAEGLMSYAPERKFSGASSSEFPALFLGRFAVLWRPLNRQLHPGIGMSVTRLAS
jgi:hypothetical protein